MIRTVGRALTGAVLAATLGACGGSSSELEAEFATESAPESTDVGAYDPECPAPMPDAVTVIPIGDSVTRGRNEYPSYRYFLLELLEESDASIDFVGTQQGAGGCCNTDASYDPSDFPGFCDRDHEAHSGHEAGEMLDEITSWEQPPAQQIDVALIMLGLADAKYDVPVGETLDALTDLIEHLRERFPGIHIAVATPIPVDDPDMLAGVLQIRDELWVIEDLSGEGQEVIVVDMHEGFDVHTMLTNDGYHGNAEGDAFIARRWFESVSDAWPSLGW